MPTKLPHLSDDHHFAIANVAARASQMEYHVEATIVAGLHKQRKLAKYLLKNLGADRIVKALKAILIDAAPDETKQIENLIKNITDLRTERHEVLHWTWIPGQKPDTAIHADGRPFREFRSAEKTAPQVQAIANEMQTVSHALMDWQDYLYDLHKKSSRDKPEPPTPPTNSVSS